jgi:hypothetical protein
MQDNQKKTGIYYILCRAFLLILGCILVTGALIKAPTATSLSIQTIGAFDRIIQNDHMVVSFNSDGQINGVFPKMHTQFPGMNILQPNQKISFSNVGCMNIDAIHNNVVFLSEVNHTAHKVASISLDNENIHVTFNAPADSNSVISLIDPVDSLHNATIIASADKDHELQIIQRKKDDGGLFSTIGSIFQKRSANTNMTTICTIPNDTSKRFALFNKNEVLVRETQNAMIVIKTGSEFTHVLPNNCTNDHCHTDIRFPTTSIPVTITVSENSARMLAAYKMEALRTYAPIALLAFVSKSLYYTLEACVRVSSNKTVGFILYLLITACITTLSKIAELAHALIIAHQNQQTNTVDATRTLPEEHEQAIQDKYALLRNTTYVLSLVSAVVHTVSTVYAIPYCYALRRASFLWGYLGEKDTFNFLGIGIKFTFSPLMAVILLVGAYRYTSALYNRRDGNETTKIVVETLISTIMAGSFVMGAVVYALINNILVPELILSCSSYISQYLWPALEK